MKSKIIMAATILFLWSCEKSEETKVVTEPTQLKLTQQDVALIENNNNFGLNFFREVSQSTEGNLMISPLSASVALSMLLNGTDNNTYRQMLTMLGYESMDDVNSSYKSLVKQLLEVDSKVSIALANALFYREGFEFYSSYSETLKDVYSCEVQGLDFNSSNALSLINGWASDNTNGKISKVLDSIDPQIVMIIMNALYFKGDWTYKFDKESTTSDIFNFENGGTTSVQMMRGLIPAASFSNESVSAIELPYGRTNYSMVIALPATNTQDFISMFNGNLWDEMVSNFNQQTEPSEVMVYLPKFKFEFEKNLNEALQDMGMVDAFNPMLADLSLISATKLYVDFVKQNTYIDVNEEGSEAAAVTTIGNGITSVPDYSYFIVNKPFVFIIRERTSNTILFIGRVNNPEY
ncbi:MAG TPA: serpin family protein [Tenuifilaceae bacterium]|nr:serpin family protein [Tenuifilaceae bacterium]